jgi:hypothetical protein
MKHNQFKRLHRKRDMEINKFLYFYGKIALHSKSKLFAVLKRNIGRKCFRMQLTYLSVVKNFTGRGQEKKTAS